MEKEIQKSILDYLGYLGAVAFKINNVGIRKPDGHFIPPRELGVPDILCCYKGEFIGIEVKGPKGKPSAHQLVQLERIKIAGGRAFIAQSIDDVERELKDLITGPSV